MTIGQLQGWVDRPPSTVAFHLSELVLLGGMVLQEKVSSYAR